MCGFPQSAESAGRRAAGTAAVPLLRLYVAQTEVRYPRRVVGGTFLGRALAIGAVAAAIGGGCARAASYAQGLDVSNWQGTIDWLQVGGAGYTFAFAKATEGTTFSDVTYPFNRSNAQWSSIRFGAYHYARPSGATDAAIVAGAIAQADHFVDVAQPRAGDLPPVLDLETTGGLSPDALVRWTQAWLDEGAARPGLSALIYASP